MSFFKSEFVQKELEEISRLQEEIYEKTRLNQEKKQKDIEKFVDQFRAKARQASLAQSRMKMLEKMDVLDKREREHTFKLNFNYFSHFDQETFLELIHCTFQRLTVPRRVGEQRIEISKWL